MTTIAVEDFTTYLKANAGLVAIVGTRVYPQNLPQKATLPAVVYKQISGIRPQSMEGADGLNNGRYEFECNALDYLTVKRLSQAVRQALSDFSGVTGSTAVFNASLLAERDSFDSITLTFRCSLDFQIWHSEAPSLGQTQFIPGQISVDGGTF
jgi:hypothetical protein